MSFSSNGLQPLTEEEVSELLNTNAVVNVKTYTGNPDISVDTSSNSFIGRVNSTIAPELADIWQEADKIQKNMYVDSSSGFALEKLAGIVGFTRLAATYSRGDLVFTGDEGTTIPEGSVFASIKGDQFTNEKLLTITSEDCIGLQITVGLLDTQNSRDYNIYIENRTYTYTSQTSDSQEQILNGLHTNLALEDTITSSVTLNPSDPTKSYLAITLKPSETSNLNLTTNPLLLLQSISITGIANAVESGNIFGDAGSLTEIISSLSGLDSIHNPSDFTIGRDKETDEQLRHRMKTDFNTVGSGTLATIRSNLLNNLDIIKVNINLNRLFTTDAQGLPPKTYEVIAKHTNTDAEVAKIIWKTKPNGIGTHGTTTVSVLDASGDPQSISFTKATDLYAYFKIDYTTLSEEVVPNDIQTRIREAVVLYGQSNSNIGLDVIPKKFYGVIYGSTTGIDDLTVWVHLDVSPSLNVDNITTWTEDKIAVTSIQMATFATNRFKFIPAP